MPIAAVYHSSKQHNTVVKVEIDIFRLIRNENFDMKYYTIILLLPSDIQNYSPEKKLFRISHGNKRIIVLSYGKS